MSGIFAEVGADLRIHGEGNAIAGMNRASGAAKKLSNAFDGVGHSGAASMASLGSSVAGVIDKFAALSAGVAMAGGALAGAAAFSAIKTGLTQVNASVENSRIGFASLFNMFGAAGSIGEGLGMAQTIMSQIRQDAAALPGETQDFVSMAQVLTGPLLQAGKGIKEIRDLTRDTVVSAAALSIPFEVASREMGMMLNGMASSHMPLAAKLGISANTTIAGKSWHDASTAERFAFIEEKLKHAKDALPLFERSWAGLTSTMSDKWHGFLGKATEPLFERMKGSMVRVLGWMDTHQRQIDRVAERIGGELGNAWLRVERIASHLPEWIASARAEWVAWEPRVESLVNSIVEGFKQAWPYVEKIGTFLGKQIQDPATALKELVAVRLAAGGMQAAPGILSAGGSIAQMFKGGGASAAGDVASAIAKGAEKGTHEAIAISSVATSKMVGDMLPHGASDLVNPFAALGGATSPLVASGELGAVNPLFAGTLGVGAEAAAPALGMLASAAIIAAVAIGAVVGAMDLATVNTNEASGALGFMASVFQENAGILKGQLRGLWLGLKVFGEDMITALRPLADVLGIALVGAANLLVFGITNLLKPFEWLASAIAWVVDKIPGYGSTPLNTAVANGQAEIDKSLGYNVGLSYGDMGTPQMLQGEATTGRKTEADLMRQYEKETKHINFNNAKIEIRLDARNEAPDRIVRRVFDAMGRAVAKPLMSTYAPARTY